MKAWICIAWRDDVLTNGKTVPTPVTKRVEVQKELSSSQILAAFKRKFPYFRNHTVHLESNDVEQVVLHGNGGPRAVDRPISRRQIVTPPAHGTPDLREQDGALQIEPPEKITGPALAGSPGEGVM